MRPLAILLITGAALAAEGVFAGRAEDAPTAPPAPGAGQMRGTVSYGRHEPAPGAVVVVRPEGAAGPLRMATTGQDGTFGFDAVPGGRYAVAVSREGYVPVEVPGIVVRPPYRAIVEVTLRAGTGAEGADGTPAAAPASAAGPASLRGTVRLAGGHPVDEARVLLVRPDGAADPQVALTAADGAFAFDALPAGRWRLQILGAGLLPLRTTVELSGTVAAEAWLASQPANYKPLPQDLLVPEEAIPPPGS